MKSKSSVVSEIHHDVSEAEQNVQNHRTMTGCLSNTVGHLVRNGGDGNSLGIPLWWRTLGCQQTRIYTSPFQSRNYPTTQMSRPKIVTLPNAGIIEVIKNTQLQNIGNGNNCEMWSGLAAMLSESIIFIFNRKGPILNG
jgi:hypothetical protein